MLNELLGETCLPAEGWVPVDDTILWKINGQEVCLLDSGVARFNIISNRRVHEAEEHSISGRGFDPGNVLVDMQLQEVHTEAGHFRPSIELIFRVSPKSSILMTHTIDCNEPLLFVLVNCPPKRIHGAQPRNPYPQTNKTRCHATQQEVPATRPSATARDPRLATTASSLTIFWTTIGKGRRSPR
jgi:hypothetical protein